MAVNTLIQVRRGSSTQWSNAASVLGQGILYTGEIGYDVTLKRFKIGDGATAWGSLPWASFPSENQVSTEFFVPGGDSLREIVYDEVAQFITPGTGISIVENDTTNDITISVGTHTHNIFDLVDVIATAQEVNFLAGVTAGTVTAQGSGGGGALVVDTNKNLAGINNLTVDGTLTTDTLIVNGTTTTINSTTVTVDDKNLELGATDSPTDATASGGGIILKGDSDHSILWSNSNDSWDFSEHVNLVDTKEYRINDIKVLDSTSLGSTVVGSSLTSVGTIGTGVWQGTAINDDYIDTINNANKVNVGAIDLDGATEMGANLADADLFLVDDGGNGNEKSMVASRIPTYVFGKVSGDITIASNGVATIAADSVALGTDTTGNYVTSVTTGSNGGLSGGAAASEGATPSLSLDITNLVSSTDALQSTDLVAIHDNSASSHKKVSPDLFKKYAYAGISGDVTINDSGVATVVGAGTINVSEESSDTTCYMIFATDKTGDLAAKVNVGLRFNSSGSGNTALIGSTDSATSTPSTKLQYFIIDGGTP